jgi:hypothetical protein
MELIVTCGMGYDTINDDPVPMVWVKTVMGKSAIWMGNPKDAYEKAVAIKEYIYGNAEVAITPDDKKDIDSIVGYLSGNPNVNINPEMKEYLDTFSMNAEEYMAYIRTKYAVS